MTLTCTEWGAIIILYISSHARGSRSGAWIIHWPLLGAGLCLLSMVLKPGRWALLPSWFLSILLINWNDQRLCCTLGRQRISVRSCPCTHHVLGIRLDSGEEEDLDPGRSRITCWHVSWNSSSWSSSLWGPLPEQLCGAGSAPSPSPSRWSEPAQNPCPKLLHRCPWRVGF